MRFTNSLLMLLMIAGCDGEDPVDGPCPVTGDPVLEFALRDAEYGVLGDGDGLWYGHPPQGGAPFAPFLVRAHGLDHQPDGYRVFMEATDIETDEVIGTGEYPQHFVCANVGDNAGYRVAPELHMRFFGWELEELEGREVDVMLTLDDSAGTVLSDGFRGFLTQAVQ